MKKSLWLFVSVLIILIIGGCGLMEKDVADMDPKDLPDVRAFQDDFTREFMASTEPVEDGYYEFESKTGGYTMKYPENATMSNRYYERKQKNFERLRYAENESKTSNAYVAIVTYDHFSEERETKRSLNLLSRSENYNGDYKEFKNNESTIHFATSKETITSGNKQATWFNFFGLISSNSSNQSLEYRYSVQCDSPANNSSFDLNTIEEDVLDIMRSVKFNNIELKEEEN